MLRTGLLIAAFSILLCGQRPEYAFYSDFRDWLGGGLSSRAKLGAFHARDPEAESEILTRYTAKLRSDGVSESEITRRIQLIQNARTELENEFWNRALGDGKANFNTSPNAFLMRVIEGRSPGAALDYGMGEGRNALFLAQNGWKVSGFDPAERAVALAQKRAREKGLTLDVAAVPDSAYDFGKERFDLVLFSWTMPAMPDGRGAREIVQKIVQSLRPEGIVVMECGAEWGDRNGMLKIFDPLQIIQYTVEMAQSDFFKRQQMPILRMIARKPATK